GKAETFGFQPSQSVAPSGCVAPNRREGAGKPQEGRWRVRAASSTLPRLYVREGSGHPIPFSDFVGGSVAAHPMSGVVPASSRPCSTRRTTRGGAIPE